MKTYVLVHHHDYGVTTYLFRSESPSELLWEKEEKIYEALNIGFDPRLDQVTIDEIDLTDIKTVTL